MLKEKDKSACCSSISIDFTVFVPFGNDKERRIIMGFVKLSGDRAHVWARKPNLLPVFDQPST